MTRQSRAIAGHLRRTGTFGSGIGRAVQETNVRRPSAAPDRAPGNRSGPAARERGSAGSALCRPAPPVRVREQVMARDRVSPPASRPSSIGSRPWPAERQPGRDAASASPQAGGAPSIRGCSLALCRSHQAAATAVAQAAHRAGSAPLPSFLRRSVHIDFDRHCFRSPPLRAIEPIPRASGANHRSRAAAASARARRIRAPTATPARLAAAARATGSR